MTKTFEPVEPVERIPTKLGTITVDLENEYSETVEEGITTAIFHLSVDDQFGIAMSGETGDMSEHLDEKTYDDFVKAIEKFRKKAEDEILPD